MDIDADQLKALLSALAPGLIILAIRQQFIAGPEPSLQDRILAYGCVSALYYAITNPIIPLLTSPGRFEPWLINSIQYLILPTILGLVSGHTVKRDLFRRILVKLKLNPNHHIPAAWDYAFSTLRGETYLIVTMNDGSQVAGYYADQSFASSSKEERDLLVEQVWIIDDSGSWTQPPSPRSILLCGKDIKTVEFVRT